VTGNTLVHLPVKVQKKSEYINQMYPKPEMITNVTILILGHCLCLWLLFYSSEPEISPVARVGHFIDKA